MFSAVIFQKVRFHLKASILRRTSRIFAKAVITVIVDSINYAHILLKCCSQVVMTVLLKPFETTDLSEDSLLCSQQVVFRRSTLQAKRYSYLYVFVWLDNTSLKSMLKCRTQFTILDRKV